MEVHEIYPIAELISVYIRGEILSAEKKQVLDQWINASEKNQELFHQFQQYRFIEQKRIAENLYDIEKAYEIFTCHRKEYIRKKNFRYIYFGAAAVFMILFGITSILLYNMKENIDVVQQSSFFITPGESRAVLTSADGRKIELFQNMADTLIQCDGSIVNVSGKSLAYEENDSKEISYNQLDIPRKGEFFLTLSDGTKVWLNSESSLKYPVCFNSDERKVYLKGEAFFEVTKNAGKPFIVEFGKASVKVLGTSFNIRAYEDETKTHTTLVKGCVQLSIHGSRLQLNPDEQGIIDLQSGDLIKRKVDVNLYISWKDGRFVFENQTLEEMMNTLERWYDLKIFYVNQSVRNVSFSGNLKRYDNFDEIIELLEMTGLARFKTDGNVVYISNGTEK